MALNYPGPWEIRLNYTAAGRAHQLRHSFNANTVGVVSDDFDQWIPVERSGSEFDTLDVKVDELAARIQAYYPNTVSLSDVELWKYATGTFDATWYSVYSLALVGTGTGAVGAANEYIMTFRTSNGGTMRAHFMEGNVAPASKQSLPLPNTALDALADAYLATDNVWIGRDNGYPVAFIGGYPGQNEAIFKKVYRS